MKTIIYLIRHSEVFKPHRGLEINSEPILIRNEKHPLSINGEKMAEAWAKKAEFQNIDVVWSSNYVRAMSTAKYFAFNNNIKVNVSEKFNERVHGVINSYDELPEDYEIHQFNDIDYKINNGESRRDATKRIKDEIDKILEENEGKRIIIVFHSTAMLFFLMLYCDILSKNSEYRFNGKIIFDGKWNYLETFKLTFDRKNLIDIENIR